jgi:hypothetical protein
VSAVQLRLLVQRSGQQAVLAKTYIEAHSIVLSGLRNAIWPSKLSLCLSPYALATSKKLQRRTEYFWGLSIAVICNDRNKENVTKSEGNDD